MAYVIVEKAWVYSNCTVICPHEFEHNLHDLLVGFFLPSGTFYVENDVADVEESWKLVSYLNGGSKP